MDLNLFQQGDVLFTEVDEREIPSLKPRKPLGPDAILVIREGEATGHAHTIPSTPNIQLNEDDAGTLWLRITDEPATVTHQEHSAITLDPGLYRIGAVREVDPFDKEIRYVAD